MKLGVYVNFYIPKFNEISISRIFLGIIALTLGIYILSPLLETFVYVLIGFIQFAILKMRL